MEITVGSVGIVETQGIASLRVYPNPTRGEIQVTSDELQVTRIEVYDVMGRMVTNVGALRATPLHCGTINIAHLPSGIYFLKITTDSGVVTRKVIKQ
ncbi:MAG: T9SS type A sorting domain-containing protein [Bacteroidales bacterium]|nr:T9SS type A sorting domain-containing protein [Bacteroidales bacterium]